MARQLKRSHIDSRWKLMCSFCVHLKRATNCKSSKSCDVHEPKRTDGLNRIGRTKSRPLTISSPRSLESSDLLNPIKYDKLISDSKSQYTSDRSRAKHTDENHIYPNLQVSPSMSKTLSSDWASAGDTRASLSTNVRGFPVLTCRACCEKFKDFDAADAHHLSKHIVSELVEGHPSRRIVEMICHTDWSRSQKACNRIERILKVHNMQKTIASFEDYREVVKIRANKLCKKHPRCLADGNELLRFYGTAVFCPLGTRGSRGVCASENCGVCRILRHGFRPEMAPGGRKIVFTCSTSSRAVQTIKVERGGGAGLKALVLCRVIAGRVHRPVEDLREIPRQSGFDSLAGKVGRHSNLEELYLLNPRALLPCFIIIFRSPQAVEVS